MYNAHLFGMGTGTMLVREIVPWHVLILMVAAMAGIHGLGSWYRRGKGTRNLIDILLLIAGIAGLYLGTGATFIYAQF